MDILLLILGLTVLIVGGEFLVKGAVGIAKKFHLSPLVIGMTIVSFGTSAPELIVSAKAALGGNPDIALGNVIGSNIANIALVLGVTILIFPMIVDRNSKVIDWPMMMFSTVMFYIFAQDGFIATWEGIILFLALIAFIYYIISNSRKKVKKVSSRGVGKVKDDIVEDYTLLSLDEVSVPDKPRPFVKSILFLLIGLVGLYFGAEWLLEGAVNIAREFGMEERVIGVTIVAFGTSVPELVTSGVAAFRKETDISIGNLIGSNIFNIMCVLGITAMIKPVNVSDQIIHSDMIWMLGIAAMLLPLMIIGKKMGRLKGVMLVGTYVVYILTLLIAM
jgi:cation:H+ antiporter